MKPIISIIFLLASACLAQQIKQSSTAYPLTFTMLDATTGAAKTGLSPTVTISKAGGSFASPSGAVTEIANGVYKVAGNATDTNTLGPLELYATGTGAVDAHRMFWVVAYDPQDATRLGLSSTSFMSSIASVGSVTGSVGSVVANVTPSGGNVGSVTSSINGSANITSGTISVGAFAAAAGTLTLGTLTVNGGSLATASVLGDVQTQVGAIRDLQLNHDEILDGINAAIPDIQNGATATLGLVETIGTPTGASIAEDIANVSGSIDLSLTNAKIDQVIKNLGIGR